MDLWIVAAATGAGYVAKYWKNQSKDENAFSQLSFGESNLVSSQSSNHLLNKFALRKKRYGDVFGQGTMEESSSDQSPLDIASVAELASMNGFENEKHELFGSHQDFNVLSRPTMTWKSWMDENSEEHIGESSKRNKTGYDNGVLVCNASGGVGSWRNRSRGKAIFSNGDLLKPLSFEEDKLPLGFHFDDAESFCGVSQLPLFKPLQMCDMVNNITGKGGERKSRSCSKMANRELFASKGGVEVRITKFAYAKELEGVTVREGLRSLLEMGPSNLPKILVESNASLVIKSISEDFQGAPDESFILYLGLFIGIIYSFISNKREVHKLKELLKETQYLVQDLQEEIETKDSMNVKELSDDNCESYTYSNAFSDKTEAESSPKHEMNYTMNFGAEELYKHKTEECSESMSRIEAELEAELEMLGLDINDEATERFPDEDEIDPEFDEDLAEGELRNEMSSGQSSGWTKHNEEGSDTTVHSGNYTVSAWELSLRLQNVIQLRLEARIKKLEIALQNNNRKLHLVDAEYRSSWLELASGEDESKIAIQPLDLVKE